MFVHCCPKDIEHIESHTSANGKRYYTTPAGKKLPSVTTVINYAKRPIIEAWRNKVGHIEADRISKRSADRGKRLHAVLEKYVRNEPDYEKGATTDTLQLFREVKPLANRLNNIHYIEARLWSYKLGMAGQTDIIGEFDGVLSVCDWKSADREKPEEWLDNYFCQELSYALMYEEIIGVPIEQLVLIIATENDGPLLYVRKAEDYVEPLIKYITIYRESLVNTL